MALIKDKPGEYVKEDWVHNFTEVDERLEDNTLNLAAKLNANEKGAVNGVPSLNNNQKVVQTALNSDKLGNQTPEQLTTSILANTDGYQKSKITQDNGKFLPLPEGVEDIDELIVHGQYWVPGAMGGGEPPDLPDAGYSIDVLGSAIDENDIVIQRITDNNSDVHIRFGIYDGSAVVWNDFNTTATQGFVNAALSGKLNSGDTAANSNELGGKTLATVESERNAAIITAINNLVAGAPTAYDTLIEIANYIASDVSGAAAMNTAINNRVQYSDIRDDLTHQENNKPLSANQGYVLKQLADTKVNTSDIIDSVSSTATNKPLAAKTGKTIYDALSNVNVNLSNAINTKVSDAATNNWQKYRLTEVDGTAKEFAGTDVRELTEPGEWYVTGQAGLPSDMNGDGDGIIVVRQNPASDRVQIVHTLFALDDSDRNAMWIEIFDPLAFVWHPWKRMVDIDDYNDNISGINIALSGKLGTGGTAANSNQLGGKTLATVESERNTAITTAINNLIAGAPTAYDTLIEIANYIASDISGAAAMNTAINNRVQYSDIRDDLTHQESGKPLSANQGYVLKQQVDAKVATSDIINALNNTSTNKPLSANMGKSLKDSMTNAENFLNYLESTKVSNGVAWQKWALTQDNGMSQDTGVENFNSYTAPGDYWIYDKDSNGVIDNTPNPACLQWHLRVSTLDTGSVKHEATNMITGVGYTRIFDATDTGNWLPWTVSAKAEVYAYDTDFNNYIVPGKYYLDQSISDMSNKPELEGGLYGGSLDVEPFANGSCFRHVVTIQTTGELHARVFNATSGAWTGWKKLSH